MKSSKSAQVMLNTLVDPSPFISAKRIDGLIKILETLSSNLQETKVRVILPTYLYQELSTIMHEKHPKLMADILKAWMPLLPRDLLKTTAYGLAVDPSYLREVTRLFELFRPIPAEEFASNIDKLGEKSIGRDELIDEFGEIVGKIIFELMAVSDRLRAVIIGFTERTANLISKYRGTVVKTHSKFKHSIKKNSGVRWGLRITGIVLSLESLSYFQQLLQMPDLPVIKDVGVFLILVANG